MGKSKSPEYQRKYAKLYRSGYRLSVPALGYQRRLQALKAIGYTWAQVGEATGVPRATLQQIARGNYTRVSKVLAGKIEQGYRELYLQPQHATSSARKARAYAIRFGWAPPLAWNDIDDPNEEPKGVKDRALTAEDVRHIRQMVRNGYASQTEMGERYGLSRASISRMCRRESYKEVA